MSLHQSQANFKEIGAPNLYRKEHRQIPCVLRELFQCIICQYQSSRKSNLKKHFMIHTKEKPFKCNDCSFCSITKSTLVLHVRTHTGEKPYECAICQRKFSRRNIIKAHVKTHTNDKPFNCSECSFITSRKDNLKFHMRRHLVEKPFKCHLCTCSFVQKCRLKRHLELHTKRFRCVSCCYQTSTEVNLLKHKLSHFKRNSFICFLCGKEFCKKYGISIHITKRHSNEEYRNKIMENLLFTNGTSHSNNKTFSDKAIATDDLSDNLELLPLTNLNITDFEGYTLLPQIVQPNLHGFMCSPNSFDIPNNLDSRPFHLNEFLESSLINLESNSNLVITESETSSSINDTLSFNGVVNSSSLNDESSFTSSSSDSDVDSFVYNTNIQTNSSILDQNTIPNVTTTVVNPDLIFNYQPAVNYLLGLNVIQPIVYPSVSLQANSPLVLASGYNNVQVSQDLSFVPICGNTNLIINNLVPNVPDPNVMLNAPKTVFVSDMY